MSSYAYGDIDAMMARA